MRCRGEKSDITTAKIVIVIVTLREKLTVQEEHQGACGIRIVR